MLFDRWCPGCGVPARAVCAACWHGAISGDTSTPIDVEVAGVDRVSGLATYDDRVAAIVLAAKNGGRNDVMRHLSRALAERARHLAGGHAHPFDVITWVPASPDHRRQRGFDQGRVLARSVSRAIGVSHRRLLTRRGEPQRGGDRYARLRGPDLAATAPSPATVLLLDDVITTGASMARSAAVLRQAGATTIVGLALAVVARRAQAPSAPRHHR